MAMECPNCGAENPDAEKYCQKCAHPLSSNHRVPLKRNKAIAVLALLISLSVLLLSVLVLASVPGFEPSVKIPPGATLTCHVLALVGDNITVSWDSSEVLGFALVDPSGQGTFGTGSRSFERTFSAYMSGEWTLHWSNTRDFSVKISFDASSSTLDSIRDPLMTEIAWLVAVTVILTVTLIAVIVIAIRRSNHLGVLESLLRR